MTAKQNSKAQPAAPQANEDIDQLLASLNITQAAVPEASTSGRTNTKTRTDEPVLLGVNPSKLKADDEMRRIFGSKVVDAEARSDQAGGMVGGSRRVRRYSWQFCLAICHLVGSVFCCHALAESKHATILAALSSRNASASVSVQEGPFLMSAT